MFQVLQIKPLITLLVLCSAILLFPAYGQTSSDAITVTTDKTTYSDGSTIVISGRVLEQLNVPISIVIKDSSQHVVLIGQVNPNPDNTYSTQAVAGGNLWTSAGTYEIDVTYASTDRTAKTTFEFAPSGQLISSNTGNQTNATQVIPEFGPISISIFAISILIVVLLQGRINHISKI